MKKVHISASRDYDVLVERGLLDRSGELIKEATGSKKAAIISGDIVFPLYGERLKRSLEAAGMETEVFVLPHGEQSKTLANYGNILEFLSRKHFGRSDVLVALGGGVTGDITGFAASTYQRGMNFVQVPTTLLAAVDSSVGGKTAVDLTAGKNLAGAFCQPAAVICDTDCLKTLPPDVFADGAAEAVKTGVLSDEALFALFEDGTLTADPGEVIARCVAYKAGVVERDEKEQGERKLLNLGHTVGHAIEKCSGYVIPHGHAVAAGLAVIARAAEALGWTEESLAARITACLSKNGLPTGTDYSAEALAEAALSDKKRAGGDITLVVPRKIGHCELRKVPVADLLPIIRAGLEA